MSLNSLTPVLPTELERQIFELMCAFTPGEDPKTHIGRMARERVVGHDRLYQREKVLF
jgi:hypothetical protein